MRTASYILMVCCAVLLAMSMAQLEPPDAKDSHGGFTGEFKPVLYVSDVEKSMPFYRDTLGFDFEGFANSKGEPYYAEMSAAGRKFGLHEPTAEAQQIKVGRQRLYVRVRDVEAHQARVVARGVEVGAIKHTDWMDFFLVTDPDGSEIAFAMTNPQQHATDPWSATQVPARPETEP